MTDHEEDGLRRRFLDEFKHLVGTLVVHAFRHPYYAYLVTSLT